MEYRKFGSTGADLSILGFGAMRLPLSDSDPANIDFAEATRIVRYAFDNGVNYLDTAYPYHGGNSEKFCAQVLKDGYREKVFLATKLPVWEVEKDEDMDRLLNEQLKKLEVEHIDFYLLHALSYKTWPNIKKLHYRKFLETAREAGKIKYIGFSFHDELKLFKEIVDDFPWDFCQIQLNYLDEDYQAGLSGLKYAHDKGLGIIIMEPLRGGMLSRTELPEDIKKLFDSNPVRHTPAEWALKYLWDMSEIGIVLSGMTTMEQTVENIRTAGSTTAGSLTNLEHEILSQVKNIYKSRMQVNCTRCNYCMPCPQGVNIPENFWALNHDAIFGDFAKAKFWITNWLTEKQRASNCIGCGLCETKCPQGINIVEQLQTIKQRYES